MWGPVHRHRAGLTPAIRAGGGDAGSLDSQVFCHPNSLHAAVRHGQTRRVLFHLNHPNFFWRLGDGRQQATLRGRSRDAKEAAMAPLVVATRARERRCSTLRGVA